jgi:tetratricopeptide (TPR) repeat protein
LKQAAANLDSLLVQSGSDPELAIEIADLSLLLLRFELETRAPIADMQTQMSKTLDILERQGLAYDPLKLRLVSAAADYINAAQLHASASTAAVADQPGLLSQAIARYTKAHGLIETIDDKDAERRRELRLDILVGLANAEREMAEVSASREEKVRHLERAWAAAEQAYLAAEASQNGAGRFERALVLRRMGDILFVDGNWAKAMEFYRRAESELTVDAGSMNAIRDYELAQIYYDMAETHRQVPLERSLAAQKYNEAARLLASLLERDPEDARLQEDLERVKSRTIAADGG